MTGSETCVSETTWSWGVGVKVYAEGMEVSPGDSAIVLMVVIFCGRVGDGLEETRKEAVSAIKRKEERRRWMWSSFRLTLVEEEEAL